MLSINYVSIMFFYILDLFTSSYPVLFLLLWINQG